ncbi:hypothetical protein [Yoonia sp. I 8.24]|uniref:hypothetical protein n=1 Tax=Yoonia sp. I 8.24 TaxID=1537229 RepID=UPI001EE118CB|nr:hypothetical protein [Yoonia sp. I 8.24]MCG3268222.1 hypothetical protein [Yoonia sp. I 8.24]
MNRHASAASLASDVTAEQIFKFLPSQATLEQAKTFLAKRSISFSAGSWDFMINERLKPALKDGTVSLLEVAGFLAEAEEHGKQHVLLYRIGKSEVARILDTNYLRAICATESRFPPFNSRSIVGVPESPTISEVRTEGTTIVIKVIEKRYVRDESSYREWEKDGQLFTSVDTRPYRAANVVRIHSDGLCEVRIHSHMDAYDYGVEARALLTNLEPLIDSKKFSSYSLQDAKQYVCDPKHRKKAMEAFDVKHTEHLDLAEGRLRPSISGYGTSMLNSSSLTAAIDAFHVTEGTVHRAGLTVRSCKGLRRNINLGLSGEDNEFFLTAKVTKSEYEYVLQTILGAMKAMKLK